MTVTGRVTAIEGTTTTTDGSVLTWDEWTFRMVCAWPRRVAGGVRARSSHEYEWWHARTLAGTRSPRRRVRGPQALRRIPVRLCDALCTRYGRLSAHPFRADEGRAVTRHISNLSAPAPPPTYMHANYAISYQTHPPSSSPFSDYARELAYLSDPATPAQHSPYWQATRDESARYLSYGAPYVLAPPAKLPD